MFKIIHQSIRTGIVTTTYPETPANVPPSFRGKPVFDFEGSLPAPARGLKAAATSAAPAEPRATAQTARPAPQPFGRPRPAGFGKRGV